MSAVAKRVQAKRPCCQSGTRCKTCPVVLRRLEAAGLAERTGKRTYLVRKPSKRTLKSARAR